jgi:hypothetical protein
MNEIQIVQNPGLGALILWHFAVAYTGSRSRRVPMPLLFLILPIVLHRALRQTITSTYPSSGVVKVVEKLRSSQKKQADVIDGINERTIELRALSLRSLQLLLAMNLGELRTKDATMVPSAIKLPSAYSSDIKEMFSAASKLGLWFSNMSLYEIALALRVRF